MSLSALERDLALVRALEETMRDHGYGGTVAFGQRSATNVSVTLDAYRRA